MQNQNVSETQKAECRSSKPDVAGSIPVAHSKYFGIWDYGLKNKSQIRVLKSQIETGV